MVIALFAIGNRKSKIANIIVPVVQRIERKFPKGKTSFLQKCAYVLNCAQAALIKHIDYLIALSRAVRNPPIFTPPGDTTGDTKFSADNK